MHIHKKARIIARSVTAATLALTMLFSAPAFTTANADSLSTLKSKYSQLQKEQQNLQKQLNDLNSKVATQKEKKAALDKNISLIQQQISVLNKQISTLNAQIAAKNDEINDTEKRIEENTELYKRRISTIYEVGNTSKLEVLLSAKSISDFMMKFDTLKVISEHDNKVINDLRADHQKLQEEKASLQQQLKDLQESQGTLAAKKEVLDAQLAQQKKILRDLENDVDETKEKSDEVKQKARETDEQINAEIARLAELRRKQLSQNSNSSQGGTSGGTVSGNYLVSYAKGFLGTRYVFGSANPKYGFDCSGFVQYVYANAAGIALTHSAAAQSGCGTPVSRSNLQPGDLVFFATGGGGINHVGIYIGNDQFIAANSGSTMAVSINGLFSNAYWSKRYVCARRILH